ncbi:hypothetical protein LRU_00468 [Ligilactobacillus ruminis SPM0211]|uniref:Uncharacterized protein n=1 Tax=Ligilactobacillus ruminis SPM0211 TaxID=1040964 RepID=F7QYH9_9LACO|nr:hypothetical protein LRU_00468 [Ligilactobacillus ruminis SPM0211]
MLLAYANSIGFLIFYFRLSKTILLNKFMCLNRNP